VYGEQGRKNLIESLEAMTEIKGEENVIVGGRGDYNLRLGNLGKNGVGKKEMDRHNKDNCVDNSGKRFIDWINEKGWEILNGCMEGDWDGEYTYVRAKGCSVIDYVMVNERIGNRISRFRIGDRMDSDHMSMELTVEIRRGREQRKKIQGKKEAEQR